MSRNTVSSLTTAIRVIPPSSVPPYFTSPSDTTRWVRFLPFVKQPYKKRADHEPERLRQLWPEYGIAAGTASAGECAARVDAVADLLQLSPCRTRRLVIHRHGTGPAPHRVRVGALLQP